MISPALRFPVAVSMRRVPLANRWVDAQWTPDAVEPWTGDSQGAPDFLGDDGRGPRWRFTGLAIELHRSEAEGYHLNVTAPEPKVFVMWRAPESERDPAAADPAVPVIVTVSYHEAARMLDGGEQVDALPLPAWLADAVHRFAVEHYRPEPRRKVRRNDPFRDELESGGGERRWPDRDRSSQN